MYIPYWNVCSSASVSSVRFVESDDSVHVGVVSTAVSADGGNDDGDVTGSRRWCRGSGVEIVNTTVSVYVGNDDVGDDVRSSCTATAVAEPTANNAVLFDGPELSATRSRHNNQRRCT